MTGSNPDNAHLLFSRELLFQLLLEENPRRWRLRRVEQFTPNNLTSCESKVSYQFMLAHQLIEGVYHKLKKRQSNAGHTVPGLESHPLTRALTNTQPLRDIPLDIVLPLAFFPKRVLLNFSVHAQDGKALTLKNRFEGSALSTEVIKRFTELLQLDLTQAEALRLGEFSKETSRLTRSIVFMAPQDVSRRLKKCGIPVNGSRMYKKPKIEKFIKSSLSRFFVDDTSAENALTTLISTHGASIGEIMRLSRLIKEALSNSGYDGAEHGYHNPIINPFMASLDYYKLEISKNDDYEFLSGGDRLKLHEQIFPKLIEDCLTFLHYLYSFQVIGASTNDQAAVSHTFLKIYLFLNIFSQNYMAYVNTRIKADDEFLVKYEQTLTTTKQWRPFQRTYQNYKITLGDAQTTHIEVECKVPTELKQVRVSKPLRVLGEPIRVDEIFGYSSEFTEYHQHFYTTKTNTEIEDILIQKQLFRERPTASFFDMELWVKYRVESSIRLIYFFICTIAVLLGIFFPCFLKVGPKAGASLSAISLIPIGLGILALVARLRPQQVITADLLRPYVCTIIFIAYSVLTAALLWAGWSLSLLPPFLHEMVSSVILWLAGSSWIACLCSLLT